MSISDDEIQRIKKVVEELHRKGKLPKKTLSPNQVLYRVQNCQYATANFFSAPQEKSRQGRYNDPQGYMRVWYGAEHPTGALAETFGRKRKSDTMLTQFDLDAHHIFEVRPLKNLVLLDLKASLSKLQITLDQITGPDYTLTQEIVRIVSRLPSSEFNGLVYESRHHPDGRGCYALWIPPDSETIMSPGKAYSFSTYSHDGMDVEEILTEDLGYSVI